MYKQAQTQPYLGVLFAGGRPWWQSADGEEAPAGKAPSVFRRSEPGHPFEQAAKWTGIRIPDRLGDHVDAVIFHFKMLLTRTRFRRPNVVTGGADGWAGSLRGSVLSVVRTIAHCTANVSLPPFLSDHPAKNAPYEIDALREGDTQIGIGISISALTPGLVRTGGRYHPASLGIVRFHVRSLSLSSFQQAVRWPSTLQPEPSVRSPTSHRSLATPSGRV